MSPGIKQSWSPRARNVGEQPPTCDVPGCDGAAAHRAPKSRDNLRDYYWFCLEHVREYNSTWNYYAGMTADQIEAEMRRDIDWHRPTWPLGRRGLHGTQAFHTHGLFDDLDEASDGRDQRTTARHPEAESLAVMDLAPPVTIDDLKRRYKELVKRHHPDTNGGDKAAEEKLKAINIAYNRLLTFAAGETSPTHDR